MAPLNNFLDIALYVTRLQQLLYPPSLLFILPRSASNRRICQCALIISWLWIRCLFSSTIQVSNTLRLLTIPPAKVTTCLLFMTHPLAGRLRYLHLKIVCLAEGVSPVLSVVFRMHHRDGSMLEMVIRHQLFFNEGAPSFIICVFDGMRLISPETNAVETFPPQYPPSIRHSPFFPITTSTPTQSMQMM